jgi:hypothetical protein
MTVSAERSIVTLDMWQKLENSHRAATVPDVLNKSKRYIRLSLVIF